MFSSPQSLYIFSRRRRGQHHRELQLVSGGCNQGWIGDGYCHKINNNLPCTYDGGDCCLIIRISLTNELLNAGFELLNGDYEISIMPNGQTSWINGDYAIWYISGYWLIGNLANNGELKEYDITNCIFLKHSRQFFSLSIQNSRKL